ncbi:hypothetical protein [Octadecabacter temperatus]|nr:hypothetical protein [Octadecabacter temperatus]
MVKEVVSPTLWMCWALTSVVVALAGPFGTFDSRTFLWRLAYWSVLIAAAIVIAIFFRAVWRHVFKGRSETYEDIAVAVSLSIVFAPMIAFLNWIVGGPDAYLVMDVWSGMVCVLAIAAGIITFRRVVRESVAFPKAAPARDRLLDRLSIDKSARVARVYSDNHHVRVIMSDGSQHRLLMRLRDAVVEIDVEPGHWIHRSHWVSEAAISCVKQADGRDVVELPCGNVIPIGPKYRPNLVEAGLLTA